MKHFTLLISTTFSMLSLLLLFSIMTISQGYADDGNAEFISVVRASADVVPTQMITPSKEMSNSSGLTSRQGDTPLDISDANGIPGRSVDETPFARINQQWNQLDGRFGPDVTVQYTVTDHMGTFKASKSATTRPDGWLNGVNCQCDIQPLDIVYVTSDQGFSATLEVITITGQIDVDTDTVTGRMDGGIFPAQGSIWVWSPKRNIGSSTDVAINAAGLYTASLSGEFDILNGDYAEIHHRTHFW